MAGVLAHVPPAIYGSYALPGTVYSESFLKFLSSAGLVEVSIEAGNPPRITYGGERHEVVAIDLPRGAADFYTFRVQEKSDSLLVLLGIKNPSRRTTFIIVAQRPLAGVQTWSVAIESVSKGVEDYNRRKGMSLPEPVFYQGAKNEIYDDEKKRVYVEFTVLPVLVLPILLLLYYLAGGPSPLGWSRRRRRRRRRSLLPQLPL